MNRLIPFVLVACSTATTRPADEPDAPASIDGALPMIDGATSDTGSDASTACFQGTSTGSKPNYDQFHPTLNSTCAGTNHQTIDTIEKVVFLGDSITEGTPPTLPWDWYRAKLADQLRAKYGAGLEVAECSAWGARNDDLLLPPHQQIHECFPGPEPKRTLIVMTVGGNDMNAILSGAQAGDTPEQTMAKVDDSLAMFSDAIRYLKDPVNFPNGSFVVFSNIYEFTDGTGDVLSCPAAVLAGFSGNAPPQMRPAYIRIDEQYMRIAVDTGTDMIFLLENFCGHGFHAGDPANECYRGPGAETWFDLTCIHPNPTGHAAMADLFFKTIAE